MTDNLNTKESCSSMSFTENLRESTKPYDGTMSDHYFNYYIIITAEWSAKDEYILCICTVSWQDAMDNSPTWYHNDIMT